MTHQTVTRSPRLHH